MTAGLHRLLESPTTSTTAGGQDSKVAWWVIGGDDQFIHLLNNPEPEQVVTLLQSLHNGRKPHPLVGPGKSVDAWFRSVTVGGNVARVVVRDWVEMPLADVERNVGRWFADHELTPLWADGRRYHSVGRFAWVTGRWQNGTGGYLSFGARGDGRPKEILRDLMRVALRGGPLPRSVLVHVIARIRADRHVDDARVALIRLALTRSRFTSQEKPMPDLDPASTDPAYVAGRLFAAYEKLQYDAHNPPNKNGKRPGNKINVTFADRYLAGAIVNPRPALLNAARDARAWLKKLRRTHGGLAVNNEKNLLGLHQLLAGDDAYPVRLTPDQQGRFVVGYHHQRAHQFAGGAAKNDNIHTKGDPVADDSDSTSTPTTTENHEESLVR